MNTVKQQGRLLMEFIQRGKLWCVDLTLREIVHPFFCHQIVFCSILLTLILRTVLCAYKNLLQSDMLKRKFLVLWRNEFDPWFNMLYINNGYIDVHIPTDWQRLNFY
jgi:hypothetical protein